MMIPPPIVPILTCCHKQYCYILNMSAREYNQGGDTRYLRTTGEVNSSVFSSKGDISKRIHPRLANNGNASLTCLRKIFW